MSKRPCFFLICVLCVAACGCSFDQTRRDKYLEAHPDLNPIFREAIRAGKVRVGMSVSDVVAALGQPTKRVRAEDEKDGLLAKWIYDYSYEVDTDPFYYRREYYHYRYRAPRGTLVRSGTEVWVRGDKVVRVEEY